MIDDTETIRRKMVAEQRQEGPKDRAALEAIYGDVWDTQQMTQAFHVHSFGAPLCVVTRKSDGQKGSLMFQHMPRFYFQFEAYSP